MISFPGQIGFSIMSILEGEIERTSLPDWRKDELIYSLLWAYDDEVDYYWSIIEANKCIFSLDERYCQILNDPRQ